MYVLYFEDTAEFIGAFDRQAQAIVMGKLMSREKRRAVIAFLNDLHGDTEITCRFEGGENILCRCAALTETQ